MTFDKKYWSEGEFTRKNGESYRGYVGIKDGVGYIFDTEEELDKVDSWKTQMDSSENFFDRILDEEISLPYVKSDIQFAANDFLTTSTLRNIILKLQENNDYIFKNAIISNTMLPATEACNILATYNDPYYVFIGKTKLEYETVTAENQQDIKDGFVISNDENLTNMNTYPLKVGEKAQATYGDYYKIPHTELRYKLKEGYLHQYKLSEQLTTRTALDPTFYPQVNADGTISEPRFNLNDLVHCDMTVTKVQGVVGYDDVRKLHLMIFFVFKTKVLIFKTIYYQGTEKFDEETLKKFQAPDINFNEGSKDILVIDTINPANKNSVNFIGLKDIKLHGNYMYLVDEKLNMILRYDITYLLHDESEIAFTIKSVRLLDNLSGDGSVNDRIYFNNPVAVAVSDDYVYVADKGNNCVKQYTSSLDYQATLRSGQFSSQNIESIAVNPYTPTLDNGVKLAPDSLWVFSTSGTAAFVSVISEGKVVYFKEIEKIQLLEDKFTWDEEFKSVKFSFTNSNYYYISTTKRLYKLHLSKPAYPFASLSYFNQNRSLLSTMVWSKVPYPWHTLPTDDPDVVWSYRPNQSAAEVLDNRGLCLCGVDTFVYTPENVKTQEQFNGDLMLHIGNLYNQSKVDTYIKRRNCTFFDIPAVDLADMIKCSGIFLYCEPATFIYGVSDASVPCYIEEDLQVIHPEEYVNPITFNGHIYKVIYNLINLKNILIGRFQGAYNTDNVMVFDQLILDNFFQQLKIDNNHDFYIYNNEAVSIIVNRVFENIWDLQYQMLEHLKARYVSTPSFVNNNYRII